jgi:glutamyl-tRNA reductase
MKYNIINANVTYKRVPIYKLFKFTFKNIESAYKELLNLGLKECTIIETCNRVEIYGISDKDFDPNEILYTWLKLSNLDIDALKFIELAINDDAIIHLLRLASGLDSLIIGEDQILNQVKKAYEYAKENGYNGIYSKVLFEKAIKVGNKVRANTAINKGSTSYGSVAVKIAEEELGKLDDKRIMLIGSGEGASMIAKALKKRGLNFFITSRTMNRAEEFANNIGGNAIQFNDAFNIVKEMDVLFIATTAPYYLITYEKMQGIKNGMLIIDLTNPTTVEKRVRELCKVIDIDEIAKHVEQNIKARLEDVDKAEKIIFEESIILVNKLKELEVNPLIDVLFKEAEKIREREFNKALAMLGDISDDKKRIIEKMSMSIVEGILSSPIDNLKKASVYGDEKLINMINRLFRYE